MPAHRSSRPSYTISQGGAAMQGLQRKNSRLSADDGGGLLAGGVVGEEEAPQPETLVDMFLSGRSSGRQNEPIRLSEEGDIVDEMEVEYIPDPPCIAPFEDEEGWTPMSKGHSRGVGPAQYWKSHATFREQDPALAAARDRGRAFADLWRKRNEAQIDPTSTTCLRSSEASSNQEAEQAAPTAHELYKRQRTRKIAANKSVANGLGEAMTEAFVNVGENPVGLRSAPTDAGDQRTGDALLPGEAIVVDKIMEKEHVRFLRLADGRGWVFDQHGGVEVMAKMDDVQVGDSWWRVACKEFVDIRRAPVFDPKSSTGSLLVPRELTVVNVKCRVQGRLFAHLADGRGWAFLTRPGTRKKESLCDAVLEDCDKEVVHGDQLMSQEEVLPVTNDIVEVGLWTYSVSVDGLLAVGTKLHGVAVSAGDVLKVDKRCYAEGAVPEPGTSGTKWLRLIDGRGWIPEKTIDGRSAVALKTGASISYPATFGKSRLSEVIEGDGDHLPSWAMGVL